MMNPTYLMIPYMMCKQKLIFLFLLIITCCVTAESKTFLVSVGISDYSKFPSPASNLSLTAKDAKLIVDLYSKNSTASYSVLIDDKATKERIINAVKRVFGKAEESDIVVFFFSGHGYPGGICAADGTISYYALRRAMSKSKCKNKMMFVDACHSGGIRGNGSRYQDVDTAEMQANVLLFLSSRNTEYSIESPSMKNGYFTAFLDKGLRGYADKNKDRIITAKELFDFVNTEVSKISEGRQHPVMWGKFDDDMTVMEW